MIDWAEYFSDEERLVWDGSPRKGMRRWPGTLLSLLGVPVLGAGVFMLAKGGAVQLGPGITFDLALLSMGALFTLMGLYLLVGHWVFEATRHRRIRYAMSDRCAYVATGKTVERIPLARLPVETSTNENGSGTVFFGVRDKWNKSNQRRGFEDIENVEHVASLMRKVAT